MRATKSTATYLFLLLLSGCQTATHNHSEPGNLEVGNRFIDAFYSFNRDTLQELLSSAGNSQPEILYYQKWAECANYTVLDRSRFFERNDSTVIFPVTVKDDLMGALQIDFNVTDTFHISVNNGKIVSVKTSSNDVDEYYKAKEWVTQNRPEWVAVACEGIWADGPTPCECVRGMIRGFEAFAAAE
jgi:hypothetical protein